MKFESITPKNTPLEQESKDITKDKNTPEAMQELMTQIIDEAEKIEIKENDRNEKGELLVSPDGVVSNLGKQNELWWKIARTESFKKWFGDWQNSKKSSKIVDQNGEPLPVFRGLQTDISMYDFYNENYYKDSGTYFADPGVFVTSKSELAFFHARDKGSIFPLFINARNIKKNDHLFSLPNELSHIRKKLHLLIPKKILQFIPKSSFLDFDATIYKGQNPEEAYEITVNSPLQMLILPNSKDEIKSKII